MFLFLLMLACSNQAPTDCPWRTKKPEQPDKVIDRVFKPVASKQKALVTVPS